MAITSKSYPQSWLVLLAFAAFVECLDYDKCYPYLKLQKTNCSLENQDVLCPSSPGDNPTFTLPGCLKHCGGGIQLDEFSGIVARFVLWLLPVLVLGAHFQFPALGWRNTMSVCAGLLGDPIRSPRCMMTRLELFRRIARRCVEAGFRDGNVAKDVASVCAACDELGFNEPFDFIVAGLRRRARRRAHTSRIELRAQASEANAEGEETQDKMSLEQEQTRSDVESHAEIEPEDATEFGNPEENMNDIQDDATVPVGRWLDSDEIYSFAEARHDLVTHRSESQLGTMFAIAGLVGALVGAFIKAWEARSQSHLSRTVPMVIMSFHLIAMVQLSAMTGTFTSPSGPLIVLQLLQRRLRDIDKSLNRSPFESIAFPMHLDPVIAWDRSRGQQRRPSLLGDVELQPSHGHALLGKRSDGSMSKSPMLTVPPSWNESAAQTGLNSTFRLSYNLAFSGKKDRSETCIVLYACSLVGLSWITALVHSVFAVGNFGFGCLALTWTSIFAIWVMSWAADELLLSGDVGNRLQISSSRILWRWTIVKDFFVSLLVITATAMIHLGLTNSCRCGSGSILTPASKTYVRVLASPEKEEMSSVLEIVLTAAAGLSAMCVLMYFACYYGSWSRTVLCPNEDETRKMQLRLQELRETYEGSRPS